MATAIPTLTDRKHIWRGASLFVLVTAGILLVLFGSLLQARIELALHGIFPADYPRALHTASAGDDRETLTLLRTARAALDHRDGQGATPLHSAVAAGAGDAVAFLLEEGAAPYREDAAGYPPLSLALSRDDHAIATQLLAHGASPLVPLGRDRRLAPLVAVDTGNLALLELLLAFDLDADLVDRRGVSLVAHAIGRKDYAMVEMLLDQGAQAGAAITPGVTYLAHAARTGDVRLATLLLDQGADPNAAADRDPPLGLAVDTHRPDMVRLLLERGASVPPAPPGRPGLLQRAAENDDLDSVRLLLEHVSDPDAPLPDGRRLSEYAVDTDKRNLLRLLLRHGAHDHGLVCRALHRGHADILAELLAGGASHEAAIDDQPLIEWAVRNASPELVGVLLDHGADPDAFTREGQPLLALAVALDRPEIVATLADHGAEIDARVPSPASDAFAELFTTRYERFYLTKDRGLTPLMLAILRGRQDTVRVFLERKARLDTPTREHGTWPIGFAAHREDVAMMQLLLGRDPARQPRRILVSLADQTAALYEDGQQVLKTRVSTGRPGYETPPGKYVITNKHRDWKSTVYDDAPMPYFLRLNAGAIGLHEGVVPRHPASHGCIRVPRGTARRLFASTRVGDPVTISQEPLATAEAAYFPPGDLPRP